MDAVETNNVTETIKSRQKLELHINTPQWNFNLSLIVAHLYISGSRSLSVSIFHSSQRDSVDSL